MTSVNLKNLNKISWCILPGEIIRTLIENQYFVKIVDNSQKLIFQNDENKILFVLNLQTKEQFCELAETKDGKIIDTNKISDFFSIHAELPKPIAKSSHRIAPKKIVDFNSIADTNENSISKNTLKPKVSHRNSFTRIAQNDLKDDTIIRNIARISYSKLLQTPNERDKETLAYEISEHLLQIINESNKKIEFKTDKTVLTQALESRDVQKIFSIIEYLSLPK